jgi:biopolymer transport protein ExbB/TolQ
LHPLQALASFAPLTGLLGATLAFVGLIFQLALGESIRGTLYTRVFFEALLTIAFGLIVAIPSVFANDRIRDRLQEQDSELRISGNDVFAMITDN